MSDYSDDDLQAMQDYANGVVGDGSKLVDLGNGATAVRDADGYAALVNRPSSYDNTIDTTDRASDLAAYKKYLSLHAESRPGANGQSADDATDNDAPQAAAAPRAAHAILADAIPIDQAPARSTTAQDAVRAKYLELFKQFPANGTAQQKAVNKAMTAQYESELNAARAEDIKTDYATLKSASAPQGKAAPSGPQKQPPAHVMANFAVPDNSGASPTIPIGAVAGPTGLMSGGLQVPNVLKPIDTSKLDPLDPRNPNYLLNLQKQQQDQDAPPAETPEQNAARLKAEGDRQYAEQAQQSAAAVAADRPKPDTQDQGVRAAWADFNAGKIDEATFKSRLSALGIQNPEPAPGSGPTAPGAAQPAAPQGPPLFPQRVLPAHWMSRISPTSQGLEQEAFGPQREADLRNQEIDARLYNQKLVENAAARSGEAYAEQERARAERTRQAAILQRTQAQTDAAQKAFADAKVDPNRFFAQQGTGGRIMAGIGLALGAFGATLGHTPNFAADIINRAIDRDIDAQKTEIAAKGKNADNMISRLRDQVGNYQDAEHVYREAALQFAQSKAGELGAQGNDAALQKQLGDQLQQLREVRATRNEAHEAYIPPQIVGGGGVSDKDQGFIFKAPDGRTYNAGNQTAYSKLTEGGSLYQGIQSDLADYQTALGALGPMDRLSAKVGTPTAAMSRAQTAWNNVMSKIRQGNDDGVWKKSETAMLENTLAPPDSFTGNAESQLGMARKHADNLWNAAIKTYNPKPVVEGYKYNARGQLEPTAAYTGGEAKGTPKPVGTPD